MKNEKLIEINLIMGKIDLALEKVESSTYKNATRTKLHVILVKLKSLQNDLERKIENERTTNT